MSVAFIGLGKMGVGIAQRPLNAGHDLRVYNRTRVKATILKEAGARVCDTAWEACAGADVVIDRGTRTPTFTINWVRWNQRNHLKLLFTSWLSTR